VDQSDIAIDGEVKESESIVTFQFLRRLNKATTSEAVKIPSFFSIYADVVYLLFPDEVPFVPLPTNNISSFLFYLLPHDRYLNSVVPPHISYHWFNGIAESNPQSVEPDDANLGDTANAHDLKTSQTEK
jgi:hypothetical protein